MKCLKCDGTGLLFYDIDSMGRKFAEIECDVCKGTGTIEPKMPETKTNDDKYKYGQDNIGEGE
jgi:DnaJ-class molecular chaperone